MQDQPTAGLFSRAVPPTDQSMSQAARLKREADTADTALLAQRQASRARLHALVQPIDPRIDTMWRQTIEDALIAFDRDLPSMAEAMKVSRQRLVAQAARLGIRLREGGGKPQSEGP